MSAHLKFLIAVRGALLVIALGVAGVALTGPTSTGKVTSLAGARMISSVQYHVVTDVSARISPTTAPGPGYGIPSGAAFVANCQVEGEPFSNGNRLYFWASYGGRQFYIPDYWTDSPHQGNQPPIAGIDICGQERQEDDNGGGHQVTTPAGPGSFANRAIADDLLRLAPWAPDEGRAGGWAGWCRYAVNLAVLRVSGGSVNLGGEPWDYNQGFRRVGAYEVPDVGQAVGGDIVQVGTTENDWRLHTYVVVENLGGGRLDVVDSNHGRDFRVRHYVRTYTGGTIWRLGQP